MVNGNDNNDSKDKVLKKVSKKIVIDDNKDNGDIKNDDNIFLKSNQKPRKNITEQLKSSENLLYKEVSRDAKKVLELAKKRNELSAKSIAETNKMVEELRARNKDREEYGKKVDEVLKRYYTKEAQSASKEVEELNKMTSNDLDMSSEKSEIINKLIKLYILAQIYYLNKIDNNSKANEKIDNVSLFSEISKLKKRLIELPQKGRGMFNSQKEFSKLLTFLAQSHAGNNSKKLKNNINQQLKSLYNSKQISELVHKNLITAI